MTNTKYYDNIFLKGAMFRQKIWRFPVDLSKRFALLRSMHKLRTECSTYSTHTNNYFYAVYSSNGSTLLGATSQANKLVQLELPAGRYYIKVYGINGTYFNADEQYHLRYKYYSTKTLSVPLYVQETPTTCGPASMRMILSFYNITVPEATIMKQANKLGAPSGDYTYVWVQKETLNHYLSSQQITYSYSDYHAKSVSEYQNKISTNLLNSHPIEILMATNNTNYFPYITNGHYVVIKGITHNGEEYLASVNDPHNLYSDTYQLPFAALKNYNDNHSGYIIHVD